MNRKMICKVLVDIFMSAGLLFLMGYHFWGDSAHEWAGAGMFLLFILHHILNWRWWRGLFRGRYTPARIIQTSVNLLVLVSMLGLMASGVILSREVFAFLSIKSGMAFARRLHMISAYWGFLLMSAHLGLHWEALLRKIVWKPGGPQRKSVLRTALGLAIALYGAFALFKRDLPTYLFLRAEFVFLDFSESKILFYLDYLAIMGTFIFLFHFTGKLLRKTKERKSL